MTEGGSGGGARFCGSCGEHLVEGARFCASCGEPVALAAARPGATPVGPAPTVGPTPTLAPTPPAAPAGRQPARTGGGPPRWLVPVLAAVLVVALVATGVVYALVRDDEVAEGEIFLATAGVVGDDPFSDRSYEGPVVSTTTSSTTAAPSTTSAGAATAIASVSGGSPGLYGGTGNQSRCDVAQMSAFLQANPARASAFVAALNADPTLRWSGGTRVEVAQLAAYLAELTPVTLTRDTRVTNHGFRDGRPVPLQSVLQAGTAVLVDRYGVPRSRCACGNPLIPAQRQTTTPRYSGPRWPGFEPTEVVVVTQVDIEITTFVLVDLETGDLFERPAGTTGGDDVVPGPPATTAPPTVATSEPPVLGTGDVQVTLNWTGDIDVDLHVVDPTGAEIAYPTPTSASGGELDVDRIPSAGDLGPHVENVFWPSGGAPAGTYQVFVRALSGYESTTADFTVDVLVNGVRVTGTGGTISASTTSDTITFEF